MTILELLVGIVGTLFWFLMMILPLLIPAITIITVVIVVIKVNKKKQKDFIENRNKIFVEYLDNIEENIKDLNIFEYIYNSNTKDLILADKDTLLKDIPYIKEKYKTAVANLVSISENNSVFFTKSEENKKLEQSIDDYFKLKDKYSDDIIKTLPCLADFLDIYRVFVLDIWEYIKDITRRECAIWSYLYTEKVEAKDENDFANRFNNTFVECCAELSLTGYECATDWVWNKIANKYPQYNNEQSLKTFNTIANEDERVKNWREIYYCKMKEISIQKGYYSLYCELDDFCAEIEEEFNSPSWLEHQLVNLSLFGYNNNSSFFGSLLSNDIKALNRDELMRIRDLYIKGVMKGKYRKYNDPKYKEELT